MSLIGYTKYTLKKSKSVLQTLTRPYYELRNADAVWRFLNREGNALYTKHMAPLNDTQARVLRDFQMNGVAISHLSELFPDRPNLLQELRVYTQEARANAAQRNKKAFLKYIWEAKPMFDIKNPLMRLAMEPRMLDIINGYLGTCAKSRIFTLNITMPVPDGEGAKQSQRWHRDPDDKKMAKFFIYLNDVDEESGPFVYLPTSQYGGALGHLFPQKPPKGINLPSGVMEQTVKPGLFKKCVGRAGSVVFADTAGLHYGGYATKNERIMFTAGFTSAASLWSNDFYLPENFDGNELSPVAQYALQA